MKQLRNMVSLGDILGGVSEENLMRMVLDMPVGIELSKVSKKDKEELCSVSEGRVNVVCNLPFGDLPCRVNVFLDTQTYTAVAYVIMRESNMLPQGVTVSMKEFLDNNFNIIMVLNGESLRGIVTELNPTNDIELQDSILAITDRAFNAVNFQKYQLEFPSIKRLNRRPLGTHLGRRNLGNDYGSNRRGLRYSDDYNGTGDDINTLTRSSRQISLGCERKDLYDTIEELLTIATTEDFSDSQFTGMMDFSGIKNLTKELNKVIDKYKEGKLG